MPAITMGGDASKALQAAIQKELARLGYSESEEDPVMAEYITIMLINDKTPDMITDELTDLIGTEYNASFTSWLFEQYNKVAASSSETAAEPASPRGRRSTERELPAEPEGPRQIQAHYEDSRGGGPRPPRNTFQQAVNATTAIPQGQKRTASMRSPSPNGSNHPSKHRRVDNAPAGPRAMRDGPGPRSLAERLGPPVQQHPQHHMPPQGMPPMPMMGGMPPMMPGMDMSMMDPVGLQQMLGAQMALMTHVAMNMGLMAPGGQLINPQNQQQQQEQPGFQPHGAQRGRGGAMPNRGRGAHARGGAPGTRPPSDPSSAPAAGPAIAAPQPVAAAAKPAVTPPSRPQSPTLCKFNTKCTNPTCKYSHASPVATVESGLVLNVEACEKGKECKDADCPKSHVSPAVKNPSAVPFVPKPAAAPAHAAPARVPCRFGVACTRPDCIFSHPPGRRLPHAAPQVTGQTAAPCKFGSACTRADCPFQHPPDRVLPGTFHRGLSTESPVVSVPTPTFHHSVSHNKSATFNVNAKAFVPKGEKKEGGEAGAGGEKEPPAAAAAS